MKVRKAKQQDLQALSQLFDGYRQFYQQPSDLEGAQAFITERIKNHQSVIFVVESNDQLLGFTQLFPSFSSVSMQQLWILNDLFVQAESRQAGVAHALMDAAKQLAEDTGSKGLVLETDLENSQAQSLYEKLGYQKQNKTHHYFLPVLNTADQSAQKATGEQA